MKTYNELTDHIIDRVREMLIPEGFKIELICLLASLQTRHELDLMQPTVDINLFDEEEIHENCTVQVLRNSVTGDVSVGWWENEVKE